MNKLISIGGDSGVGKTTLSNALVGYYGTRNSVVINGDDLHKWERGNSKWLEYTHLNPKANKLPMGFDHLSSLKSGDEIHRSHYDHSDGKFTPLRKISPKEYIISEGLHSLYHKKTRDISDIKVYVEASEPLKRYWKVIRDIDERGYSKDSVLEHCSRREDDFIKYIEPQKKYADIIVSYQLLHSIDTDYPSPDSEVQVCSIIYIRDKDDIVCNYDNDMSLIIGIIEKNIKD